MGKYIEISKKLKEVIFNGKFKEDEKLPSARKLAQNYEINVATVLRALHVLREQQIICKNRTSRFYVCHNISCIRQKCVRQEIQNFFDKMSLLGYSKIEVQNLLTKQLKKESVFKR